MRKQWMVPNLVFFYFYLPLTSIGTYPLTYHTHWCRGYRSAGRTPSRVAEVVAQDAPPLTLPADNGCRAGLGAEQWKRILRLGQPLITLEGQDPQAEILRRIREGTGGKEPLSPLRMQMASD